jgi:hypothetical protein
MKIAARHRRGMALLAVLGALLVVSVLASSFFLRARDASSLNAVVMAQAVASANAELGMQDAIRRVRAMQVDPATVGTCTTAEVNANTCTAAFSSGMVSRTSANPDLLNGDGLIYQFIVYQRPGFADPAQPGNRYVVRATGYYGFSLNSPNLVTSILESEVDIGRGGGTSTRCVGGYDCVGG